MTRGGLVCLLAIGSLLSPGVRTVMRDLSVATVQASNISNADRAGSRRGDYVGDAACVSCHKEQGLNYLHTSHYLTSRPVNKDSVLGSFQEGANVLMIVDPASTNAEPGLYLKMEAKDGGYFQTAVTGWGTQLEKRTERMDIVTGSGVRGATYLYWEEDQLFELPVSYWTDGHRWINSPGYA